MDHEPKQPGHRSTDAERTEPGDCSEAGDRRHRPEVVVTERAHRVLAAETPDDRPRRMAARLHRHLGHTGQVVEAHQVTDDIHLRTSR